MQSARSKQEERRKAYKKGIDADEARRKRDEHKVEIRKTKREETLMKKRRERMGQGAAPGASSAVGAESSLLPPSASSSMDAGAGTGALVSPGVPVQIHTGPQLADLAHSDIVSLLPPLRDGMCAPDAGAAQQLACTHELRKILSIEHAPPIQDVINCAGIVDKLVEFLTRDNELELQFEAAWALTNIASGTSSQTESVVAAGSLPLFVRLMSSPSEDVREQASWALGNVAGDSTHLRDMVLAHGALEPLLAQLSADTKISMLRNATWTLSNFCRGKPQPDFSVVRGALPVLANLVYSTDQEVLVDTCWTLSYLSDDKTEDNLQIEAVVLSDLVRPVVELLVHPSMSVQQPALRVIGNVVTGTDEQTQHVLNCDALSRLRTMLSSPKRLIRKEACWTISNITAGTREQIDAVVSANIVSLLINLLSTSDFDTRREAAWAISNATAGGSGAHIRYLVSEGCIKPMCDMLAAKDTKIVQVALEGLENILRAGEHEREQAQVPVNEYTRYVEEADGLEKIEQLQNHSNDDIYRKAVTVIEEFFGVEDDEEVQGVAPVASSGDGFGFGVAASRDGNGGGGGGGGGFGDAYRSGGGDGGGGGGSGGGFNFNGNAPQPQHPSHPRPEFGHGSGGASWG